MELRWGRCAAEARRLQVGEHASWVPLPLRNGATVWTLQRYSGEKRPIFAAHH